MAAKKTAKKRKKKKAPHHARAKAPNPKPKRKKKRKASHRAKTANPKPKKRKKKRKSSHAAKTRPRVGNPGRKHKKKRKRAHKKNPDVPVWAMAAIGAVLGLVSFTLVSAGTFALTQRTDPSLVSLVRNRRIAAGLFTVGGVALALVSPMIGAGVAAGGLAVLVGTEASLALGTVIDKPIQTVTTPAPTTTTTTQKTNGVFNAGGGQQRFPGTGQMNAVFNAGSGGQRFPNMQAVVNSRGGVQSFPTRMGELGMGDDGYGGGATAF